MKMTGTRVFALFSLIVIVIAGAACAITTKPGVTNTYVAHASKTQNRTLKLPDGGLLIIPAGAMMDGATITAAYANIAAADKSNKAPVGPQVQFSVQPGNAIQRPLQLELPLPKEADPKLAKFGLYHIGYFDSATRQWIEVDTSYDPTQKLLIAQISNLGSTSYTPSHQMLIDHTGKFTITLPSVWDVIKEAGTQAVSIAKCLGESMYPSEGVNIVEFLRCMAGEEGNAVLYEGSGAILLSALPNNCLTTLAVDGMVAFKETGGIPYVEALVPAAVLLGDLVAKPECQSKDSGPQATLSTISPSSGPTKGRNTVVITGTQISSASRVSFGDAPANFSFDFQVNRPPNSIVVAAPAHAAGTVDVRLTNAAGTPIGTSFLRYTYTDQTAGTTPTATPPPGSPTPVQAHPTPTNTQAPAPPPTGTRSIHIGWSSAHPTYIWMTLNGFSVGSYQYTCSFSTGGNATFTLNETTSPETWDNGHTCYDTVAGDVVWVQIGSVSSNKITVPSASPPPPTESIQIGWSSAHPTWIWMTMNGFPVGSYQYTCSFSTGGNATFTLNETTSPESWDNGHTCYDTVAGDVVWVQIGSVGSNRITVSAPPPPSESIQIGWSSAHPTWIWMTLNGFPVGSYQYTCSFSTGGNATFTLSETSSPETWDNGRTCYDTVAGDVVWVQIGSVSSNKITVP